MFEHGFYPTWSTLKKLIWLRVKTAAGEIWRTITAAIATFTAVPAPLRQLSVAVEPVQNGTGDPSTDNVRPITGWDSVTVNRTGVNAWDEEWEQGTLDTSTGGETPETRRIRPKNFIPVKPSTQYAHTERLLLFEYDASKQYIGYNDFGGSAGGFGTFTTSANCYYLKFTTTVQYGVEYHDNISFNYPSTDHDYHPYSGNEYTIQLGETVYGGTLDVVNGKMTVDRYYLHVDAVKSTWGASNGFVRCYRYMTGYDTAFNTPLGSGGIGICNMLTYYSNMYNRNAEGVGLTSGANGYFSIALTTERLNLSGSETSAEMLTAMNAWLLDNPLYILYPLATPFDITLTPEQISTLQGTNNVWSDAGNVTVEYRAQ